MNNKKGFTLVELLAVIVILSIILVVSTPKVLDIVENTREESFRKSANLIASTAKLEYSQNLYGTDFDKISYEFDNKTESGYKIGSSELKLRGDKPSSGQLKIDKDGRVAFAIVSNDERYCATKKYDESEATVKKYIPSECKLELDDEIIGEQIEIEIKATPEGWSQYKDVTITSISTIESTLQYQFVKDSSGTDDYLWQKYDGKFRITENGIIYARLWDGKKTLKQSSLKITTIDTEKPVCVLEVSSGTEGNDVWYTSNVTLKFKALEDTGGSEISEKGISNIACNTDDCSYTLTSDGNNNITAYVKDNAGNEGSCEIEIYKDSTKPTCSYSGESTTWTKNNRTVTTSCTDATSGCTSSSKSNLFSTTTKTSKISNTFEDEAGNSVTCSKTANIYVDKTKPTLGTTATFTNLAQSSYKMKVTSSDSHSGIKNYTYSVSGGNSQTGSTSTTFTANKVAPITVTVYDNAGNSTSRIYTLNALESYIIQLYEGALLRTPEESGFNHWKDSYISGNNSIKNLVSGIYLSTEANNVLTTNTQFATQGYRGIFGREPDSGGLQNAVSKLDNGTYTRSTLISTFTSSTEFSNLANFYNFSTTVTYDPQVYAASVTYTCPDYWAFDGVETCSNEESYSCTVPCTRARGWVPVTLGSKIFVNYWCPNASGEIVLSNIKYTGCKGNLCSTMGTPYSYCTNKYKWSNEQISSTCSSTCTRTVTETVKKSYSCNNSSATLSGTTCYYCARGGSFDSSTKKCIIK